MALFFKRKKPEQCECDSAEAVKIVANRIEALTAKLAKAVTALENLADCVDLGCFCSEMQMATAMDIARATLAALHAGGEEWPTS